MTNTKLIFKLYLGIIFITSLAFSHIKIYTDDTIPIDEGLEKQIKIDPTKGVNFDKNSTKSIKTIYLKEVKKDIKIIFTNASHLPLYYNIVRDKKIIKTSKKSMIKRSIEFVLDKSYIKDGDKIIFINNREEIVKVIEIKGGKVPTDKKD